MTKFTISNNDKIGYVSEKDSQQMTIIDETATISSTQRNKQVFSPKQTFPPEPYVKVPPPILLDIEEFMPKKSGGSKTSNAFIIYRTVFAKVLIGKDFQSKMTDVSKWAAISWKNEKSDIKTAYKKFAKEIQLIHKKRSQDALISRKGRLIAANTQRLERSASISSQLNPQRYEPYPYPQQTNSIIEHENVNFPVNNFPTYPITQNFNPESSDKEFQSNDPLNPMTVFDGFGQSPVPSSIEEENFFDQLLNRDLEVSNLVLMQPILQPQLPHEIYSDFQFYENNEPGWVLNRCNYWNF
ncbi:hypothetical protein C1645_879445 [Glomus cerebriforme]|uniref:HMG box domain-containing protein n=1 Tax=Glomus cerebriforme TaxID=658196 RepID=A0A397SRB8_9GLOM|nr:hypothetical protein C1645_879445 [Glomus cerebriforme]